LVRDSLIGRGPELDRLDAELTLVVEGRLRVVLLLGEAGMGKTRLASEFVARHRGAVVALSARAYPPCPGRSNWSEPVDLNVSG
jgi:transcriptional regulator with GAF, ATPase, and Fis domain